MTCSVLIAGFGGQGILFAGKFLAYDGLLEDRHVSWLPSYGPEMRGGTANCSIILSDSKIGSPIVAQPDILIAMNLPSLDKYEADTVPGGKIFTDSSLIDRPVARTDVEAFYIPATTLASEHQLPGLANMVMMGYMMKKTGLISPEHVEKVLSKVVSARKMDLLELNKAAIELGYHYTV